MTAKTTARKTAKKRKAPSTAEMKRQISAEKQKGDMALAGLEKLAGIVGGLAEKIDNLSKFEEVPEHDPSARLIGSVLREEEDLSGIPAKPEILLPDQLARAKRAMARNNPVTNRNTVDTGNEDIGQLQDREMSSEGEAKDSLDPAVAVEEVEIDGRRWSKNKLDLELFMHEKVCIRVHDTSNDTLEEIPEVGNGGVRQFFIRNEPQWVARKFVEVLARAKKTTYSQVKVPDGHGGNKFKQVPHTTLLNPFEVIEDTPKGKQWVRQILKEA